MIVLADTNSVPTHDIRLVYFDIDGTLVNSRFEIGATTRQQVARLHARGVKTALASGRPYFSSRPIAKELGINSPCSLFSAGCVIDPLTDKVLMQELVAPDDLDKLLAFVREHGIFCEIYNASEYFVEQRSPLVDVHLQYLKVPPKFEELGGVVAREQVIKAVLMFEVGSQHEQVVRAAAASFPQLHFGYAPGAAHPEYMFCNITNVKASRERVFKFLLDYHGLDASQVMALGDGEQDVPFLRMAGVGVAMGNASQAVKEAARYVTLDVEQDGVGYALDRLVK